MFFIPFSIRIYGMMSTLFLIFTRTFLHFYLESFELLAKPKRSLLKCEVESVNTRSQKSIFLFLSISVVILPVGHFFKNIIILIWKVSRLFFCFWRFSTVGSTVLPVVLSYYFAYVAGYLPLQPKYCLFVVMSGNIITNKIYLSVL